MATGMELVKNEIRAAILHMNMEMREKAFTREQIKRIEQAKSNCEKALKKLNYLR